MYAPKSKLLYNTHDFHWIKNSPSPAIYLGIVEKFDGKKFRQRGKGCHILYALVIKDKIYRFWPMRAGGENFLLANISTYTVCA